MGRIEQNIARQAYNSGEPLPERIANAPQLEDGLEIYLEAFFELDTERSHGMGLTQIPWSSIQYYAEAKGFDEDLTEELHTFVRAMDTANLARLEAKGTKPVGNSNTKGSSAKAS